MLVYNFKLNKNLIECVYIYYIVYIYIYGVVLNVHLKLHVYT